MKNEQDKIELHAVEDHGGLLTIRGGGSRRDWNGIHYKQGMSAKNVGTTKLSVNIATVPPGGANKWGQDIICYNPAPDRPQGSCRRKRINATGQI